MRSRKGQAALEYLMTHGWTILVLTAIIVALYTIGAFSPARYMRQECYFQPDLYCQSFRLAETAEGNAAPYVLTFTLNNGLGFDVLFEGINVTATDLSQKGETAYGNSCSAGICVPDSGLVRQGEQLNVSIPIQGSAMQARGSFQQIIVRISYRNCKTDPNYDGTPDGCADGSPHVVSGRITANVE